MKEAKESFTQDGFTYNLHIFGGNTPRGHQGCFECYSDDESYYAEGALWIQDWEVVDYDGVYSLPPAIVQWLATKGVTVPEVSA